MYIQCKIYITNVNVYDTIIISQMNIVFVEYVVGFVSKSFNGMLGKIKYYYN